MILIHGFGRMGRCVADVLTAKEEEWEAVDPFAAKMEPQRAEKTFVDKLVEIKQKPSFVIDFSCHSAIDDLLAYGLTERVPLVLATTGYTDAQRERIRQTAACIPIFVSANMSLAVAALTRCAVKMVWCMPQCCVRIEEIHHCAKKDAPSGTALQIADSIKRLCRPQARIVTYPSGDKNDIAIVSVRQGNEVGLHRIYLTDDWQQVVLQHQAYDRRLFALGAYRAGLLLMHKSNGLYDCTDLLTEEWGAE